ncbi:hypothetical protein [Kitasatospora viridis]|uniref:Secreted protein n=1 Tax=Kitasatospora viridis TaxID=281105 RepID=A0A561UF51_9ACTN|nr:hypothetical protein [Kitasatospora viridis]TWF97992.1 hypothetical protein FHX73_111794 [Kitasatospora viridis]
MRRLAGGVALLALVGAALVGCSSAQQAVSCGKTAISIAGDVQDLGDSATNVGQLTDQARRQRTADALKKLADDAGKLKGNGAAEDLDKAVRNAQQGLADGKQPDLGPVSAAADDVAKSCTHGA